jgi:hypothetical protein
MPTAFQKPLRPDAQPPLLQCDLGRQRRVRCLKMPQRAPCCLNSSIPQLPRVFAQGLPPAVPTSYCALADHGEVPRSTLHARAQGRRSMEEKAQSQQYLSPCEEDALLKFLLQIMI